MKKRLTLIFAFLLVVSILCGCSEKTVSASSTEYGQAEKCVVIILDGFSSEYLSRLGTLSNLALLSKNGACCLTAHSTYPTHTCTNHATIMTGVGASTHGIVGNVRLGDDGVSSIKNIQPEMIKVPTLFEIASAQGKTTAMVSGKNNMVTLLSSGLDIAVSNLRPLAGLADAPTIEDDSDNNLYYTYNMELADWVFESLFTVLETESPDLTLVNIQSPDYIAHRFGPESKEMTKCIKRIDKRIGELYRKMDKAGMLDNTALIITADHGMTASNKAIPLSTISLLNFPTAGVAIDGRNGYIWLGEEDKQAVIDFYNNLEGVREVFEAGSEKAVELDVDFDGGPDIFLETETGYEFLPEPMLKYYHGQHGSQDDSDLIIPIIALGAGIPSGAGFEQSDLRCIAPMVCRLMQLEPGNFDVEAPGLLAVQKRDMFH